MLERHPCLKNSGVRRKGIFVRGFYIIFFVVLVSFFIISINLLLLFVVLISFFVVLISFMCGFDIIFLWF